MPRDGSSGVDGTFQVSTRPVCSSNRQMSVKVPPESTPTRHLAMPFLPFVLARMLSALPLLFLCAQKKKKNKGVASGSPRPPHVTSLMTAEELEMRTGAIVIVSVGFEFLALPAHTPRIEIGVARFMLKSGMVKSGGNRT